MSVFVAVDVGGTNLRAARYSGSINSPDIIRKIPTHHKDSSPTDRILSLIQSVLPEDRPADGIGLAVPGAVNPFEGIVYVSPNIKGWQNVPLKRIVSEKFQVPTVVGNDANMAALGEWQYGSGQGHSNLIYFTISTGIGSGIILEDRLLLGKRGLAGELGHVTVDSEGPICSCGERGHLEAIASGTAIARWVKEKLAAGSESTLQDIENFSTENIAQAAENGDPLAISAFKRAGFWFGRSLANFLHIFNPSAIIIGGGVSKSWNLIIDPIMQSLEEHVISDQYCRDLVITPARLGDQAGLAGAYSAAQSLIRI